MKLLTCTLITVIGLSNQAFAERLNCREDSRRLSEIIDGAIRANSRVSSGIYEADRLVTTLERGARQLGSGRKIDLRRELDPLISNSEDKIRPGKDVVASAMADFREMPKHGSYAYELAAIASRKLENGKTIASDAINTINVLKDRVRALHSSLSQGSNLQQLKREIHSGVQGLDRLDRAFYELSDLSQIRPMARDYTSYCSDTGQRDCRDYRTELNRSADQLDYDHREVGNVSNDLNRVMRQVSRVADGLVDQPSVDLNGALLDLIERQMVVQLQNAYNDFQVAASNARQASTAESGVEHVRLAKIAETHTGYADQLLDAAIRGASEVRSRVNSLANELDRGGDSDGARQLLDASREVEILGRRLSALTQKLGDGDYYNGGHLGDAREALDKHRRYCELP